jgi:hypothetical protein
MATLTASVSGLASVAATWGGAGTPADGDTLGCNAGVEVEWDLNVPTATTGFIFTGWNGTLKFCRTAGSYGYKVKTSTSFEGSGKLDSGADYPSDCQFTITHASSAKCTLDANLLDCALPDHPYLFTKAEYGAGTSKIYVVDAAGDDVDVTADAEWKNGFYVRVDNNSSTPSSEEFTISATGSDAGGYYVTLSAGLAATKVIGSTIVLCSRNIQINGSTSGSGDAFDASENSVIRCAIRGFAYATNNVFSTTFNVVVSGCKYGLYSAYNNHCEALYMSGNTTSAMNVNGLYVEDYLCSGATRAWYKSSDIDILGGVLQGNSYHCNLVGRIVFRDCVFGEGTKWYQCTASFVNPWTYLESINDGNVAGAYDARTAGGTVSRATGSGDYTITCEDADNWAFRQTRYTILPGEVLLFASDMDRSAGGPDGRIEIVRIDQDPLVSDDFSALATQDMVDDTQTLEITWQNVLDAPVDVYCRMYGKAASGTLTASESITNHCFVLVPYEMYGDGVMESVGDPDIDAEEAFGDGAMEECTSIIALTADPMYGDGAMDSIFLLLVPEEAFGDGVMESVVHAFLVASEMFGDGVMGECTSILTMAAVPMYGDGAMDSATSLVVMAPTGMYGSGVMEPVGAGGQPSEMYGDGVMASATSLVSCTPAGMYGAGMMESTTAWLEPVDMFGDGAMEAVLAFLMPAEMFGDGVMSSIPGE